ncbi:hypothetical protein HY312_03640 [Candidatus Saccharibacteria bacterium]|nr:hypothetical protein [Candidatus Saccharibacteria bacterium]
MDSSSVSQALLRRTVRRLERRAEIELFSAKITEDLTMLIDSFSKLPIETRGSFTDYADGVPLGFFAPVCFKAEKRLVHNAENRKSSIIEQIHEHTCFDATLRRLGLRYSVVFDERVLKPFIKLCKLDQR